MSFASAPSRSWPRERRGDLGRAAPLRRGRRRGLPAVRRRPCDGGAAVGARRDDGTAEVAAGREPRDAERAADRRLGDEDAARVPAELAPGDEGAAERVHRGGEVAHARRLPSCGGSGASRRTRPGRCGARGAGTRRGRSTRRSRRRRGRRTPRSAPGTARRRVAAGAVARPVSPMRATYALVRFVHAMTGQPSAACATDGDGAVGAGERVDAREEPAGRAEAVVDAAGARAAAGGVERDERRAVVADAHGGVVDPADRPAGDGRGHGEVAVGLADERGQERGAVAQGDRAGAVAGRRGGRGGERRGGVREALDVPRERARRGPGEGHELRGGGAHRALAQQQRGVQRAALVDGERVAGRVTGDGQDLRRRVRVDRSGRGPGERRGRPCRCCAEGDGAERPDTRGDAGGKTRHGPCIGRASAR